MSSAAGKMAKAIKDSSLRFDPEMYDNTIGSLVICAVIFSRPRDYSKIRKIWTLLKENPKDYNLCWMDDPDFPAKWLKIFGMKIPKSFPVAMVQSSFNTVFLPYIDGKLLPIREDGRLPASARHGKVYPVDFTKPEKAADAQE